MSLLQKLLEKDVFVDADAFEHLNDQQRTQLEQQVDDMSAEQIEEFLDRGTVEIVRSYTKKPAKRNYQHFVGHFKSRLRQLSDILRQRQELSNPQSIARLRKDEQVAIIGLVWEKQETKNGHIILTLEDTTGKIKVLLSKNRQELIDLAGDIMLDEVIGITGLCAGDIVFADTVFHPDIPAGNELKKAPDEAYAIFLSDLHFGNKDFYEQEFMTMLKWLRGEVGSPAHKHIASKIKYLFIAGDMIEGVGIYPGQEDDLSIPDIKDQYKEFADYIRLVPQRIQVIMCPGNHDAGRLAEPQLSLYTDFTDDVLNLPNIHLVSNPSYVRIHKRRDLPGFLVLLYHGFSYIYYGNNVASVFDAGGVNVPHLIMKYLLQRRHLAPTHTSNLYIPDPYNDPLVIDEVPDFFVSGHVHMGVADTYKGVTVLNCSCWVPETDYQKNAGLNVDACKLALVNLQTRQVKMMSFLKEEEKDE